MIFVACALICMAAVVRIAQGRGLARPWPWAALVLFALVLWASFAYQPLARVDRLIGIATLASVLVFRLRGERLRWLALAAVGFNTSPNTNIMAGYLMLAPLGMWTLALVPFTRSAGALVGLAGAWTMKYVLKREPPYPSCVVLPVMLVSLQVITAVGVAWNGGPGARAQIWPEAVRFFLARPLTGWGPGSYYASLANDTPEAKRMNAVVGAARTVYGHAHNAVLTIAVENGLLGLAPLAWLLVVCGRIVWRSEHPAKWSVIAFAFQQGVDDTWLYPPMSIMLGLALNSLVEEPCKELLTSSSARHQPSL